MTPTQIEVAFYNPRKGNIPASIKTKDGNYYGVEDNSQWNVGSTYAIEYTERAGTGKWQGRTFRDIKSAKLVSNAPAANSNGSTAGHAGHAGHGGGGTNSFRNPEQMFVEALLAKGMETGTVQFSEEALSAAAFMLQTVWQRLWGDNG